MGYLVLQPTEGEIRFNSKLKMGIYNQHFVDILPMEKTPVEHLRDQFQDQDYQSIRNRLGRYGLQVREELMPRPDRFDAGRALVVMLVVVVMRFVIGPCARDPAARPVGRSEGAGGVRAAQPHGAPHPLPRRAHQQPYVRRHS